MRNNPKVSVVVPVYGVEKYLRQCVESILTQTLDDIEVILVDDGSPDKCSQIIDEYAARDSRIVPVHQSNGGYGVAVNNGINAARGDYVGIIEPDDWIEPTMYEKLYNNAVKNKSDVVKCSFYVYDSTQKPQNQNRKWETDYVDLFDAPEGAFALADYPGIVMFHASVWASLYRADFIKGVKMIETRSASYQDFPFMCEVMSAAKRISVEKDCLVHYRMEPNQNSSTKQTGEHLILMATQSINGIEILKTNGALDLVKEEIYWHAYTSSIGFFRSVSWQFKEKFFNELHRLFAPLAGTDFKFKHFPKEATLVANAIIEGNYPKTVRRMNGGYPGIFRRMLIQIHIPNSFIFKSDHFRIIFLGFQIAEKGHLAFDIPSWKRTEIGVGGIMRGIIALIVSAFIPFRETRRSVRRLIRGDTKYEEINAKAWHMYSNGDDRHELARFCAKNDTRTAWKHCPHDFWLVWTSALYELGDKTGAAEVIKRYAGKYGIFDIYRYVLAAKCAFENGIISPEIEQAVYVWDRFQESRRAKLIEKMIAGKRVAIVGNGPQAVGKGAGAEIDAADIVIRFNGYQTAGFEEDYGTRTDIWVWGAGDGIIEEPMIRDCKLMVWCPEYSAYKIFFNYLDILYRNMKVKAAAFDFLSRENWIATSRKMNLPLNKSPSTGVALIHYILKYTKPKSVRYYAFSFLDDDKSHEWLHYYNDGSEKKSHPHNLDYEVAFIKNSLMKEEKK
jgi:glycosyltransferase involved in cell wall biosynthesis